MGEGERGVDDRSLRHGSQWSIAISNIFPPACNHADATSVDRISSYCRSRTGFLGSPDFHISPRSRSCCSPPLRPFSPVVLHRYIRLSPFRQLQQLREIMEKPRGETEITDVLAACGVEIDGNSRRWRTEVAGTKRERCRERGERQIVREKERDTRFSRSDSTRLRSRFTVSSCKFYDVG